MIFVFPSLRSSPHPTPLTSTHPASASQRGVCEASGRAYFSVEAGGRPLRVSESARSVSQPAGSHRGPKLHFAIPSFCSLSSVRRVWVRMCPSHPLGTLPLSAGLIAGISAAGCAFSSLLGSAAGRLCYGKRKDVLSFLSPPPFARLAVPLHINRSLCNPSFTLSALAIVN